MAKRSRKDVYEETQVVAPPRSMELESPYPQDYVSPYRTPKRYRLRERLGAGGCGEVFRVFDTQLERTVAMKMLRFELADNSEMRARFLVEAHITAQLQHPGIVSVHDRGELDDGGLWFTMEEVRGRTLAEVIADHHFSGGPHADAWPLRRLMDVFTRAVQAVGYAHRHGVVHRDLKPDNLMIGEFGEVLVMDWGLARRLNEQGDLTRELPSDAVDLDYVDSVNTPPQTAHGAVLGTPTYMPPEQARGERHMHGPHSDVYSLGAILYLILTGRPPYLGTAQSIWRQVVSGPPAHVNSARPNLALPGALVAICVRAMQRDVMDRYANAEQMAAELQEWLDGQRRRERALEMLEQAHRYRPEVADLREQAVSLRRRGADLLAQVGPHEPIERLRPGWALEDAAASLEREATLMETRWLQAVHGALMVEPDLPEAHAALSRHYRRLLSEAERSHAFNDSARYEVLLRAHHHGEGDAFLRGEGTITLLTDPPDARVLVDRYMLKDRRLSAQPQGELGLTPQREVTLARGSYLLRLRLPGYAEVSYPVLIERGEHWDGRPPGASEPLPIVLPRQDELADDDCYVPAGWFWAGGDPEATDTLPWARVWVDAFIIKRHPVTNAEYLSFLNHLVEQGREQDALAACPRAQLGVADADHDQLAFGRAADGQFVLDSYAGQPRWQRDWPVVLVDWFSACAYAAWIASRTGQPWRLPTEMEREKAARGVDGRKCPWGDHLDARFCHVAESQESNLSRASIHADTHDVSSYGVVGLAGNSRDWCLDVWSREGSSIANDRNIVAAPPSNGPLPRVVRGGAWSSATEFSRSAARFAARPSLIRSSTGFRLVRALVRHSDSSAGSR